jgi:hypothetical protein
MLTHLLSRIRAVEWSNGGVTLTDPEMAQLAQDAADSVEPGLRVHIAPGANDDPYRWGPHGWTVSVETVRVWIPAETGPREAFDEIARQVRAARSDE